ncbi:transporter substrate-binding domain-containing protein [Maledivibacter halophilus]|uniref:histidine kinase n=1 Tax=Maledivibacter halophilus TaxID=36842 RepID=A0A1T5IRP0_9FIRM|nr:transporter substrate-binding domain-containing protein [Maledivibacter halophilus]SKC41775.1 polar amino acid transport system substrate-binding protein [Maledivibacter halophilus]
MKKTILVVIILFAGLLLNIDNYINDPGRENSIKYVEEYRSPNVYPDFISEKKVEKTIKIGVDNHLPPYSYVNDNGIVKGFYIDIMRAISIEIGVDVEVYPMPWYEVEEYLENGKIDGALAMSIENENTSIILSDYLLKSSKAIFVRKNNRYIVNLEDLRNVKIAVHKGNISPYLSEYLDADNITFIENQQQGIQMLMNGKVDAFIGDKLSGFYTIQKWKQENFIKVVGDPINEESYGIALLKEDEELRDLFNIGYRIVKDNGTYDKIYKKWFGETFNNSYVIIIKRILYVLGILLILVVIIILFVLRWNTSLKKEVQKRTKQLSIANKQLLYQKEQLESNDRFKEEILNSLLSGIVTLNRNKIITFINLKGIDILKLLGKDIIGKSFDETIFIEFFKALKLTKVLNEGKFYRGQEIEIKQNKGIKTFNCNLYPLKDKNENINGAILNFRDISQEKKIKAELSRKDKMRALGLMVAGLAHEIRNPLTSIKTFVDLIPQKIDNPTFKNKFMEIVPNEINRLNNLITDLLEYSKPRGYNPEEIYIKEMFNSILILFSKNFKDKCVSTTIKIDDDHKVFADKPQIKQVFINLILNSIDSISNGGIIKIYSKKINDNTHIIIEDNGKGIAKKDLDKIMDPFFTTKNSGTGLGLFICYQIVQENNGDINIESKIDQGTKVRIILPNRRI